MNGKGKYLCFYASMKEHRTQNPKPESRYVAIAMDIKTILDNVEEASFRPLDSVEQVIKATRVLERLEGVVHDRGFVPVMIMTSLCHGIGAAGIVGRFVALNSHIYCEIIRLRDAGEIDAKTASRLLQRVDPLARGAD